MKVFDFNIHLPMLKDGDVNNVIANETEMDTRQLIESFDSHLPAFGQLQGGNIMLFNMSLFALGQDVTEFFNHVRGHFNESMFTALLDFRRPDINQYMDTLVQCKVDAVKFHSYVQKIKQSDFAQVVKVAKMAEANKMAICIDASFGTTKMYEHDNIKLICALADEITQVPIVILHSGGARCIEAMLIALEKDNVFIETSFSLPFYQGSTIENDLAFVYKKVGADKVIYGSDSPYVTTEESMKVHLAFFEKHGFSSGQIETMLYHSTHHLKQYA